MSATHTLVMTGAGRGIGLVAARRLLAQDPSLHLLVLPRRTGTLAAELTADPVTRGSVSEVGVDLSSLASARGAADQVRTSLERGELPPLQGFVGNAGIQHVDALTPGAEGHEATFTVNVLANHVVVRALEDLFVPGSRIVITVSDTHFGDFRHNLGMVPAPVWNSPDRLAEVGGFERPSTTTAGRTAYSTSKLAAIHLVHKYARRLPVGLDAISWNPGFVPGTALTRNADAATRFVAARILPLLARTPWANDLETAGGQLADLLLGRIEAPRGSYVDRDRVAPSSAESYSPERESELWETVERLSRW